MKINKVTITGADNKIKGSDLLNLQEQYPFVEWGILYSKIKEGSPRYPTKEYIEKEFAVGKLNLSAHFCGWWSKEVLEAGTFSLITGLPEQFKRIQLNYNFRNSKGWNLVSLVNFTNACKSREIILQYNNNNAITLNKIKTGGGGLPDNIHFLYDSSGGRGTKIQDIQNPIGKHYTGYSGGLDIDTIDSVCKSITSTTTNDINVWIDMESGVRTNNEFDLDKTKAILKKCALYVR